MGTEEDRNLLRRVVHRRCGGAGTPTGDARPATCQSQRAGVPLRRAGQLATNLRGPGGSVRFRSPLHARGLVLTMPIRDASATTAWQRLKALAQAPRPTITDLFATEPDRTDRCIVEGGGLTLDFSRQRGSAAVVDALTQPADELDLRERIAAMYRGDIANPTENRQVLHTALRREGAPHAAEVKAERDRMLTFADAVRAGSIRGSHGETFNLVVNIGIGGSDLGPAMAVEALRHHARGAPRLAFVSNVDGCRLADTLAEADPRRTLFIICSKTFTTIETRTNAESAKRWLAHHLGIAAVPDHFAAVSVNAEAMDTFGVHPEYRFAMWDWVGGRYSIW